MLEPMKALDRLSRANATFPSRGRLPRFSTLHSAVLAPPTPQAPPTLTAFTPIKSRITHL
ncbi:MAG: hypothetical protein ACI4RP_05650 [Acutalibacteraceae bacterium]